MSEERELLQECYFFIDNKLTVSSKRLLGRIDKLLAQPEQSTDSLQLTEQASFKPDWVNYRQGVEDSKREPLRCCEITYPEWAFTRERQQAFDAGVRFAEKAHGIGE